MVEPANPDLSIDKQCKLLSISRSTFYYQPTGETALNLVLMRQIDEQFLETPFFGVRQMTWHLRNEGHLVNEKRIRRLMRLMGLMPIYQKPNTSKSAMGHKTYPDLLKGLRVIRPNQVWAADITYLLFRCSEAFCIWSPSWTGTPARCWPGGYLIRWRLTSASRRLTRRSTASARRDHEHGSRFAVHVICLDRPAAPIRRAHLDGWQRPVP